MYRFKLSRFSAFYFSLSEDGNNNETYWNAIRTFKRKKEF